MADYELGYMKPPKSGQFQPGQSGNPKGRPSGSQNTHKLLDEIVNEKIQMTKNGRSVRISKKQAMLLQATNKAVQGDLRALQTLLPMMTAADDRNEQLAKVAEAIRQDDKEILTQYLKDNINE